jgi:ribosomal-protein-alanine N-acetyltransferase
MDYPIRLETQRLWTRPITRDDRHDWAHFLADVEATRYFPNPENLAPDERAAQWVDKQLTRYAEGRHGMMVLIHKETGAFIGQCGLLTQTVDATEELEVGYHIFPQYWRQGYASEAAIAFRNLAFENGLRESIISIIHRENVGSQGVALRNGMQREKATQFWSMDVYVYRIWRTEWELLQTSRP